MKRNICFWVLCLLVSVSSFAWGPVGHRIVSQVAYRQLTATARAQVDSLLGKHGIIYCATWPDEIKSDTIFPYTHVWHFQNLSADIPNSEIDSIWAHPLRDGKHLIAAVDSLSNVLRANQQDTLALRFLIHLVPDMFQPMHLGSPNDRGGNDLKMKWFDKNTNVHFVWDELLIDMNRYSYSEYAQYLSDTYSYLKNEKSRQTLHQCMYDTYILTQAIYAYQALGEESAYHYKYRFQQDLDEQLYTAGIQLGKVLNELFARRK